jgi:plastocyanin domain-containing protein
LTIIEILVTVLGLAAIIAINYWFFLSKRHR